MKPTSPLVALPVWKDLFLAAGEFRALEPLEVLDDLDLIGVRDPSNGEMGFGVVMGSGGTLFGFCLYRGAEGFDIYRAIIDGSSAHGAADEYAMQNCLLLEFGARSDLQPADLLVIRQSGLSFKGKHAWPEFRSLLPGYAPWFLMEAEARFLTLGLRVACHHAHRLEIGEEKQSYRDGEYLVYSPAVGAENNFDAQWEAWPSPPQKSIKLPVLNLARLNAISGKKLKPDTSWKVGAVYLPSMISDGERPYYIHIAAVCQQSSGFAFCAEPSPPETPVAQMLADAICSSIAKSGFLPEAVVVENEDNVTSLEPLGKTLGFSVRRQKKLRTIQALKKDMMERFVV